MAFGKRHASMHLFPPTEAREVPQSGGPGYRFATPAQIPMIAQRQRVDMLCLIAGARGHGIDRQGLIELGKRPQRCKSGVEMGSGGERDVFLRLIPPMAHRDHYGNLEVSRDVQRPNLPPRRSKLCPQIVNVVVAEPVEVDRRTSETVVPPDGAGIPLHELQEPLHDCFLECIASRAATRVGAQPIIAGSLMEIVENRPSEDV